MSFFKRLSLLLCITLISQSSPIFANPINTRSLSTIPTHESSQTPNSELIPVDQPSRTLVKRGNPLVPSYGRSQLLGKWRFVFKASYWITNQYNKETLPYPSEMFEALTQMADGAKAKFSAGVAGQSGSVVLHKGALELIINVRNQVVDIGQEKLKIPWDMVEAVTRDLASTVKILPMFWTGVVTGGDLPPDATGAIPWFDVSMRIGTEIVKLGPGEQFGPGQFEIFV